MANANKAGKATKNTATKKNATTTRRRTAKADPVITSDQAVNALAFATFYVVSERKLLTWTPLTIFRNREDAYQYAEMLQAGSNVAFNKFKVDTVYLHPALISGPDAETVNG